LSFFTLPGATCANSFSAEHNIIHLPLISRFCPARTGLLSFLFFVSCTVVTQAYLATTCSSPGNKQKHSLNKLPLQHCCLSTQGVFMNLKPTIMLSTTDLARLEHLLSQLPPHSPEVELLEQELERAIVVKPAEMPPDRVTMNSRVQFSVGNSSQSQTLTLVYPKDLDSSGEKISILAPVGSAILGLAQGDEIAWPTPANPAQKIRIEAVLYQPESAGDLHR
jgi:regulator of nucleoside diphosphate kinase